MISYEITAQISITSGMRLIISKKANLPLRAFKMIIFKGLIFFQLFLNRHFLYSHICGDSSAFCNIFL